MIDCMTLSLTPFLTFFAAIVVIVYVLAFASAFANSLVSLFLYVVLSFVDVIVAFVALAESDVGDVQCFTSFLPFVVVVVVVVFFSDYVVLP